jgi:hypothetical protein
LSNPLRTVTKGINLITAIFNPSESNVQAVVNILFPRLDPVELRKRVIAYDRYLNDPRFQGKEKEEERKRLYLYCDPVPALFLEFNVTNYGETPRRVLASWWPYISEILLHPESKLYSIMAKDESIGQILGTKEGIAYLKFLAQRDYDFFYDYITQFPRAHISCGPKSRIKYGQLHSGAVSQWCFYCDRCGKPFSEQEVYGNETVKLRPKKKAKTGKMN